jgi:hypothetical protein
MDFELFEARRAFRASAPLVRAWMPFARAWGRNAAVPVEPAGRDGFGGIHAACAAGILRELARDTSTTRRQPATNHERPEN